jgi:hypothetical protein
MRLSEEMRTRMTVTLLAAAALLACAPAAGAKTFPPHYEVGIATRSINPGPDGKFDGQPVYLGGYGIGGGSPVFEGRPATGVLRGGVDVRAIVIGDGTHYVALADAQLQGWFAAARDGAYGISDVRHAVEQATNGKLKASDVIVQSDHTHSGPDLLGVWGGAPASYRAYVVAQTEAAILDAFRSRRTATLSYGTADGRDLLSNQFGYDAANQAMDSDVRVLQARDARGAVFATLLNFSAHATVLGSSNTKATGDWPEAANRMLEQRFGGTAITIVGTLGRTQPADRGCSDPAATGDAQSVCMLDDYAGRVAARVQDAVASAQRLKGTPVVDTRSYLIEDVASNPLLLGMLYGGAAAGIPVNRALTPPWMAGSVLGSTTASARIGDILLSAGPGEMYPQIPLEVRARMAGLRGYMTAGLADDQLGYLIAPYMAYPEPIRRSFFDQQGDQVSPIDNDNYFFNVSHTMGMRVTCSLLRGAGELFGRGDAPRDDDSDCVPFTNDAGLAPGADTTTPGT